MAISDVLLKVGLTFKTYLDNRKRGQNLKIFWGMSFMDGPKHVLQLKEIGN